MLISIYEYCLAQCAVVQVRMRQEEVMNIYVLRLSEEIQVCNGFDTMARPSQDAACDIFCVVLFCIIPVTKVSLGSINTLALLVTNLIISAGWCYI